MDAAEARKKAEACREHAASLLGDMRSSYLDAAESWQLIAEQLDMLARSVPRTIETILPECGPKPDKG